MTITNEQVEAACREYFRGYDGWAVIPERVKAIECIRMRAALEAAEAARETGDFVLVPRELTEEMMDASEGAAWATKDQLGPNADFDRFMHEFVQAQWRAALKAAPKPDAAPSSAEQPALPRSEVPREELAAWVQRNEDRLHASFVAGMTKPDPGAPDADERARFEAWAAAAGMRLRRVCHVPYLLSPHDDSYESHDTQAAFNAWQARAKSSAAPNHTEDSLGMVAPVSDEDDRVLFESTMRHIRLELHSNAFVRTIDGGYVDYALHLAWVAWKASAAPVSARDGELAALRAFANDVIAECVQFDPDIQELAEQHGLLAQVTVTEPCGDNCQCAEVGFPAECYRKTAILLPADRAMGGE